MSNYISKMLDNSFFTDGLYGKQFATTGTANHPNNNFQTTAAKTDSCVQTTTPSPSSQPGNTQSTTTKDNFSFFSSDFLPPKTGEENLSHSEQASPVMITSEVALVSPDKSDSSTTTSSTFHPTKRKTVSPKPNFCKALKKTTMCDHALNNHPCGLRAKCNFAHTVSELKPRKIRNNFKDEPCVNSDPHNFKGCLYRHPHEIVLWSSLSNVTVMIPSPTGDETYVIYMKGRCH